MSRPTLLSWVVSAVAASRPTCWLRQAAGAPHFHDKVVSELRQVPGFVGAQLNRRPLDDKIEFLVLTRWQSMDAIQAFAGTDAEKAVVLMGRNGRMQSSARRVRSCLFERLAGAPEGR